MALAPLGCQQLSSLAACLEVSLKGSFAGQNEMAERDGPGLIVRWGHSGLENPRSPPDLYNPHFWP